DDDADQAEKVSKEKLQKEAEIRRLKEEDAELMERKQKLQLRVQRRSVYQDFMEQVVKMTKLALRAVNSAHSAYACFLFSPLFFQHYSLGSGSEQGSGSINCKLLMKCAPNILSAFVLGITKTHNLRFQESEALQAVFASHLCPNVLKAPARLLCDMVMHFPLSQEEITLSVTPLRVSLRNYCEEGKDHMKTMYTEMSLHPDEFDFFQVGVDLDLTFCLKELRGLLSFAESHSLPVSVNFSAAGKPVCFSVEDVVLGASVVLATLIDSESRGPSQPAETLAPVTHERQDCSLAAIELYTTVTHHTQCHESETDYLRMKKETHQQLCCRDECVVYVPRCADAAVLLMGSCEADSGEPRCTHAEMDLIASSQGSPIINPPALMLPLPQTDEPNRLCELGEACASFSMTPASSTICSLLFNALSSEQDSDGYDSRLPVLACYSDGEESMQEDHSGRPSL
ncbi:Cell cycle checkpoint control protein RAD9B, partial [Nibea albiflora]